MEGSEVWKMRLLFPKEFHSLVKMHLSFLLDLTTDDCDCSFIYDLPTASPMPSHKHIDLVKKILPTPRKSASVKGVIEGLPLTMEGVCQIYQLVQYLKRPEHLKVEGLFRKHGNLKKQQALRERLNRGIVIDLDEQEFSVHEVASVLKMFLSELPEPLLTDAYYRAHCQVASLGDEEKQVHALQLLLFLIPDSNYQLLRDTLLLLNATAKEEESNKMSASNLATVFASHLLCPRKLSAEALQTNNHLYIKAITLMINEAPRLFEVAPVQLAEDVSAHFKRLEENSSQAVDSTPRFSSVHRAQTRRQASLLQRSQSIQGTGSSPTKIQSPVVNTIFSFVDRRTTQALNEKSTTATELAKLYAHVQSMPESAQKKRLVQKLNDANGMGTPGMKLKSKTQRTKNHIKNLLTPKTTKTTKLNRAAAEPGDDKKGWHTNSYDVAKVITSEQRPSSSAMTSFKRRSSESRQVPLTAKQAPQDSNKNSDATSECVLGIDNNDHVDGKAVFQTNESDQCEISNCDPRKVLEFDAEDSTDSEVDETNPDEVNIEHKSEPCKLPPPPVPPRISSLQSKEPSLMSPNTEKTAAIRELSTPRNRRPLIAISNSILRTPESDKGPVRWDSGYLSQKLEEPSSPLPNCDDTLTTKIVDVDEMLEKMDKEASMRRSSDSPLIDDGDDDDWPPAKTLRLTPQNERSFGSTDESITSSVIREEAEQLLRGDLDPSDSMCAFLDGDDQQEPFESPLGEQVSVSKRINRKRSITELGGPACLVNTTPSGIYFETDL